MSEKKIMEGIQFPQSKVIRKISTSNVAKTIINTALQAIAAPQSTEILQEKNWRKNYPYYFKALVEQSIKSAQNTLIIAQQGIASAKKIFEFHRNGKKISLIDAMQSITQQPFDHYILKGQGEQKIAEWAVPLNGKLLTGQVLLEQLEDWEQRGIIESSHAHALRTVQMHPEWFDLSQRTIVLFGAASEAGPLTWLSKWKANIIALDLPNEEIWQKIKNVIQQGNATLIAPQQIDYNGKALLGVDLLTQTPEIANWLNTFNQQLDLAGVAYLDGEKHVRVTMAMIAIMQKVSQLKSDSSLMFMLTPTDIYAIPKYVVQAINKRKQNRQQIENFLSSIVNRISFTHLFKPNDETLYLSDNGEQYAIADCMVIEQGPNYALAKRLQQWYALVARENGQRVSINIAPSTTTRSVVKNPVLKAAFDGADLFGIEAFDPETTNAIMAALWIYDLNCQESVANPEKKLDHPLQLIMENANHGGLWYVPYLVRTALPFSAVYGWSQNKLHILRQFYKK